MAIGEWTSTHRRSSHAPASSSCLDRADTLPQVRADHDALTRSLLESNDLLSPSELSLVFTSLIASHALTWAFDAHKAVDDRKVALGMEIGEVGRVLMGEGEGWRRALAGT